MKHLALVLVSTAALTAWQSASAQHSGNAGAAGDWEFRIGPAWIDSKTVDFNGGTTVNLSSTTGIKIGTGYYVTDQLIVGGNFSYASGDFRGNVASGTPGGGFVVENGHIDYSSFTFDATYLLPLQSAIKPFGEIGLGWAWYNTNIASGPPQTGCWWDPWWGYYCGTYQPTRTAYYVSYMAALGVRWEIDRSLFVRALANRQWLQAGGSLGNTWFDQYRVDLGFKF